MYPAVAQGIQLAQVIFSGTLDAQHVAPGIVGISNHGVAVDRHDCGNVALEVGQVEIPMPTQTLSNIFYTINVAICNSYFLFAKNSPGITRIPGQKTTMSNNPNTNSCRKNIKYLLLRQ